MKKIAVFVHGYTPARGGLENLMAEIVNLLGSQFEFHIFTGQGETLDSYKTFTNWVDENEDPEYVHRLPFQRFWQRMANKFLYHLVVKLGVFSPWYFGPLLRFSQQDEDIIAECDSILAVGMPTSSILYGYHYARRYNKPLVILSAYHPVRYYQNVPVFRQALKYARSVICLSQYEKINLQTAYPFDHQKIHTVVYSPFSAGQLKKMSRHVQERLQRRQTKPLTLGYVGQITLRKNLAVFVPIIEALAKNKQKIRVLFAGQKTNSSPEVERIFAHLPQVEIRYNFSEPDKAQLYKEIDIFIHPSIEESFGIASLEAMYYGCLVLTRFSLVDNQNVPLVFHSAQELVDLIQTKFLGTQAAVHWSEQLQAQEHVLHDIRQEVFREKIAQLLA